jgi:ribosomal protein L29
MKRTDLAQLRTESTEQLRLKVAQLQRQLSLVNLEVKAGKNSKARPALLSDEIAQVLTILREKELAS